MANIIIAEAVLYPNVSIPQPTAFRTDDIIRVRAIDKPLGTTVPVSPELEILVSDGTIWGLYGCVLSFVRCMRSDVDVAEYTAPYKLVETFNAR